MYIEQARPDFQFAHNYKTQLFSMSSTTHPNQDKMQGYVPQGYVTAGTQRRTDVVLTYMRRDDVPSTSVRHHFDVMIPLL